MKVFLLKDVEKIGLEGEIIKVAEGFAHNFLIPRKLAIEVTSHNEASFQKKAKIVEKRHEVIATQTSMLAERIKALTLTLKRKTHDDGKLYGSVSPAEVVDLMADRGVSIAKNQIEFAKMIKETGNYVITIKLSSKLQPKVKLTVVAE